MFSYKWSKNDQNGQKLNVYPINELKVLRIGQKLNVYPIILGKVLKGGQKLNVYPINLGTPENLQKTRKKR